MKTTKTTKVKKKSKQALPLWRLENMETFLSMGGMTDIKTSTMFADKQLQFFMDNPNEIIIDAYRLIKGVHAKVYLDWLTKFPYLKERDNFLKEMLAYRRKSKLHDHNPNTIAFTQYQYDPKWEAAENRKDDRAKNVGKSQAASIGDIIFKDYSNIKNAKEAKKKMKKDPIYKEKE